MKKLFENIEGNKFRLLSEGKEINEALVASGVKKVFMNSGDAPISYYRIESVGMGYIKDINTAKKVALQEARELMKEFGYKDSEDESKFVKDTPNPLPVKENDYSKLSAENPEHSMAKRTSDEDNMSNPEEKREVQIGKEILDYLSVIYTNNPHLIHDTDENDIQVYLKKIESTARRLLKMHGQ
jgi:hypothetical protein